MASTRPFRIFALPLARTPRALASRVAPPSASPSSTPTSVSDSTKLTASPSSTEEPAADAPSPLLYFHVSQPDPEPAPSSSTSTNVKPSPTSASARAQALASKGLQMASDQWLKLGQKPKNSWMYWFYARGEGLMDRIEFEEWMLKGVHEGRGVKILQEGEGGKQERIEIPLLRPSLPDQPLPPLVPKLHRLLIHRIPYHRKMMFRSLAASPITIPFALIPIIPNFPLFYVLWRAWSHYKAWRGAFYLEQLVKLGMIVEKPSKELDEVYASRGVSAGSEGKENMAPDQTQTPSSKSSGQVSPSATVDKEESSQMASAASTADLAGQAKGENTGSTDGTTSPDTLIYEPASKTSPASTVSSSSSSSRGASDTTGNTGPATKPGSKIRHPSLLIGLDQIPLLVKAFDLRPYEVVDINRAVEQADKRAKERDAKENKDEGAEGTGKKGTEWRGNLHR